MSIEENKKNEQKIKPIDPFNGINIQQKPQVKTLNYFNRRQQYQR